MSEPGVHHSAPAEPHGEAIRTESLARPIRQLFWGVLLVTLDFDLTLNGFSLDLLPDLIGAPLAVVGAFGLREVCSIPFIRGSFTFYGIVSIFAVVQAVIAMFPGAIPPGLLWAESLFNLASLAALLFLCLAFGQLTRQLEWTEVSRSWNTTVLLVAVLQVLPFGTMQSLGFLALMRGGDSAQGAQSLMAAFPGLLGIVFLILLGIVPIIHLLMSLHRTRRRSLLVTSPGSAFGEIPARA